MIYPLCRHYVGIASVPVLWRIEALFRASGQGGINSYRTRHQASLCTQRMNIETLADAQNTLELKYASTKTRFPFRNMCELTTCCPCMHANSVQEGRCNVSIGSRNAYSLQGKNKLTTSSRIRPYSKSIGLAPSPGGRGRGRHTPPSEPCNPPSASRTSLPGALSTSASIGPRPTNCATA
jgi:hypothetical protein